MRKRNIFGEKKPYVSGTFVSVSYQLPYRLKDVYHIKEISKEARVRLEFLEFSETHSVTVTCRRFGISRATYYRWKARFNPRNLKSLENRSRRPKNIRRPKWTWQLAEKVRELRELYPTWGKAKLVVLLKKQGIEISESTVGRILTQLKRRGLLREPVRKVRVRKVSRKRIYATRKPKDYEARAPGDIVEIDTLDVRPEPGEVYKQFSAVDVVSKFAFGDVRSAATATLAREFLQELIRHSPFQIRAVQTDGGSEFYAEFEEACKELGIKFFCLPPRSPKLNGGVERLNRTFREEFWACYDGECNLGAMRSALRKWLADVYNKMRPHQKLGYLTPVEYLEKLKKEQCLA